MSYLGKKKLTIKQTITKNYNKMESKGLGDTVEKFTKATGIKKLAESIPGGCGCQSRKEKLNNLFPYNK